MRYCELLTYASFATVSIGHIEGSTNLYGPVRWNVQKRIAPTSLTTFPMIKITGTLQASNGVSTATLATPSIFSSSNIQANINYTATGGGDGLWEYRFDGSGGSILVDVEL